MLKVKQLIKKKKVKIDSHMRVEDYLILGIFIHGQGSGKYVLDKMKVLSNCFTYRYDWMVFRSAIFSGLIHPIPVNKTGNDRSRCNYDYSSTAYGIKKYIEVFGYKSFRLRDEYIKTWALIHENFTGLTFVQLLTLMELNQEANLLGDVDITYHPETIRVYTGYTSRLPILKQLADMQLIEFENDVLYLTDLGLKVCETMEPFFNNK